MGLPDLNTVQPGVMKPACWLPSECVTAKKAEGAFRRGMCRAKPPLFLRQGGQLGQASITRPGAHRSSVTLVACFTHQDALLADPLQL